MSETIDRNTYPFSSRYLYQVLLYALLFGGAFAFVLNESFELKGFLKILVISESFFFLLGFFYYKKMDYKVTNISITLPLRSPDITLDSVADVSVAQSIVGKFFNTFHIEITQMMPGGSSIGTRMVRRYSVLRAFDFATANSLVGEILERANMLPNDTASPVKKESLSIENFFESKQYVMFKNWIGWILLLLVPPVAMLLSAPLTDRLLGVLLSVFFGLDLLTVDVRNPEMGRFSGIFRLKDLPATTLILYVIEAGLMVFIFSVIAFVYFV